MNIYGVGNNSQEKSAAERDSDRDGESAARMVKFLKPNKAVIIPQRKYATCKAVTVRASDEEKRDRPNDHCLVVGLSKYREKVIHSNATKKQAKKSCMKAFIKLVHYKHIMLTCYTLDVDLKDVFNADDTEALDKKVTGAKEAKARLEERLKTGKNRWVKANEL